MFPQTYHLLVLNTVKNYVGKQESKWKIKNSTLNRRYQIFFARKKSDS